MTVTERERERYMSLKGQGGKKILHWEHWSNPDAETYLTGIDHYERPRDCRKRLAELYPMLDLPIPESNEPLPRPTMDLGENSADHERHTVRWGDSETATFEHGEKYFRTEEDVFAFHPLQHPDFRAWPHVVVNYDYTSEEALYNTFIKRFERFAENGYKAPEYSTSACDHYNTMIMWPMLTFGWELFLATCLDEEFEPVMAEFAELNRRAFRAYARLPIHFFVSHDDIAATKGPICSPKWMQKYIFPRYEEYWGMLLARDISPIFMTDGRPDQYVEDVFRCGARGLVTEPYCDFKAVARKHPDAVLAGEGDNRILTYGTKDDIKNMVLRMAETGKMCGGYFMCIGNHIPWNVPGESIKYYFEYSDKYAWR